MTATDARYCGPGRVLRGAPRSERAVRARAQSLGPPPRPGGRGGAVRGKDCSTAYCSTAHASCSPAGHSTGCSPPAAPPLPRLRCMQGRSVHSSFVSESSSHRSPALKQAEADGTAPTAQPSWRAREQRRTGALGGSTATKAGQGGARAGRAPRHAQRQRQRGALEHQQRHAQQREAPVAAAHEAQRALRGRRGRRRHRARQQLPGLRVLQLRARRCRVG